MVSNSRPALLALAMALGPITSATGAPASWEKPDATESMLANDTSECRASAEKEAARRYPYDANWGAGGSFGTSMSQTRDWANRSTMSDASFNACMERKGYRRSR
jgi:hypothetical protein